MASCVKLVDKSTDASSASMFNYMDVFSLIRKMMAQSVVTSMQLNNVEMNVQNFVSNDQQEELEKAAKQGDIVSKIVDSPIYQYAVYVIAALTIVALVAAAVAFPVVVAVAVAAAAAITLAKEGIDLGVVIPAKMQIANLNGMAEQNEATVSSVGAQAQEVSTSIATNMENLSSISSQTMRTLGNTEQILKNIFSS